MRLFHLNCGVLHAAPNPRAACHCLLVEHGGRLVLVDTGIGLQDIAQPVERVGQMAITAAGFQFQESLTAARQIESLGFRSEDVGEVILTHCDRDHVGGLADFPNAQVHLSEEEFLNHDKSPRYSQAQFSHSPKWVKHCKQDTRWFGLEARKLKLAINVEMMLVSLPGHTLGHCGVALRDGDQWLLHVGDAYYLRVELTTDDHPVSALATARADDDNLRRRSLAELQRLARDHSEVTMFGYHDFSEFPAGSIPA
ncbi:MAG: MBL fold metallo-hydrolase [Fimbriiglobus sp.]